MESSSALVVYGASETDNSLMAENQRLREKNGYLCAENINLENIISGRENELQEIRNALAEKDRELQHVVINCNQLQSQVHLLTQRNNEQTETLANNSNEIEHLNSELSKEKQQCQQKTADLAQANTARIKLFGECIQLRKDKEANELLHTKWKGDAAISKILISQRDKQIEKLRFVNSRLKVEAGTAADKNVLISNELQITHGEIRTLRGKLEAAQNQKSTLDAKLASRNDVILNLQAELEQKTLQCSAEQEELKKCQDTILVLKKQLWEYDSNAEEQLKQFNEVVQKKEQLIKSKEIAVDLMKGYLDDEQKNRANREQQYKTLLGQVELVDTPAVRSESNSSGNCALGIGNFQMTTPRQLGTVQVQSPTICFIKARTNSHWNIVSTSSFNANNNNNGDKDGAGSSACAVGDSRQVESISISPSSTCTSEDGGNGLEQVSTEPEVVDLENDTNSSRPEENNVSIVKHGVDHSKAVVGNFCICGVSLTSPQGLQSHIHYFTTESKFECQICGDRFIQTCYLRRHYSSRHKTYVNVGHGCGHCGEQFETLKELRRHQAASHFISRRAASTVVVTSGSQNNQEVHGAPAENPEETVPAVKRTRRASSNQSENERVDETETTTDNQSTESSAEETPM